MGAVSVQVVLLGLRMGAIFLVMLAGRGRALFLHDTESDPRVGPIEDEARRSEGSPCFPGYVVNI
jgi:hypothetical protein